MHNPHDPVWKALLQEEQKKPYFQHLEAFLDRERAAGKTIFPPPGELFSALDLTPFKKVKVVILGQDPYHGEGQAHGLAFSVKKGVRPPPSLVNIFKELHDDLKVAIPDHGNLEHWARQGVLLLNTVLTVESAKPGSHRKKGWETFTDKIIQALNERREHLVFILWGAPAQKKGVLIDRKKHLVLESAHPSPLSVYRGFAGSKPFSQANDFLHSHRLRPIDWSLS